MRKASIIYAVWRAGRYRLFQFVAPPQNDDDILFDITSTYGPFELDLRVVLVEGVAPTFIHDKNGDGRFTAADLRRMGFTILSNEARLRLSGGLRRARD